MIIIKRKTFSSKKKKLDKKEKERINKKIDDSLGKDLTAAGALGVGVPLAASTGFLITGNGEIGGNEKLAKESREIAKKLIENAEKQGTKFHNVNNSLQSHYLSRGMLNRQAKTGSTIVPGKENRRKFISWRRKKLMNSTAQFGKGGDYVAAPSNRADYLSHELGHSTQFMKGRGGSKVGKLASKAYHLSKDMSSTDKFIGVPLSFANGYHSGQIAAKAEKEGKKESVFNKVRTAALPTAIAAPMLATEADASIQGLKMLKKAGASKALRRKSARNLLAAGLTYGGVAATNVGAGYLGRALGKASKKENY